MYTNVPKLVQSKQPQHNKSWLFCMYFVVGWGGGSGCCMSPSLARKSVSPYAGDTTADTKAALPIPTCACTISACPNNDTAASVWDL